MALTKIIATIGPASEKKDKMIELIKNGADVFRLNLKHNLPSWHNLQIAQIKRISSQLKKPIGLMLDLPSSERLDPCETFKSYLRAFSQVLISEIDFLAISFVKTAKEIQMLKNYLIKRKIKAKIIAKIETKIALQSFKNILKVADGILIARGDLAVQIPYQKVPYYQKIIIKKCLSVGKPVIVATQMLCSMVENAFPTRAEISDVANAILDYTDAVMLSEETAIGKYPSEAVKTMEKICDFWERKRPLPLNFDFIINNQPAALCYSAFHLWNSEFCKKRKVKAFLVLSKTGFSARMLSRLRPKIPILVFTNQKSTRDQLTFTFGTFSTFINLPNLYYQKTPQQIRKILTLTKKTFDLKTGDTIIFLHAEDWGKGGRVNILRIQDII